MRAPQDTSALAQVHSLQDLLRGGLEHHTARGVCAFHFTQDERLDFCVHLEPGQLRISPGPVPSPDATVTLRPPALEVLTTVQGQIDLRDPQLAGAFAMEGRKELYLMVLHSLQRPFEQALKLLAQAEEQSRLREQTSGPFRELERVPRPSEEEVLRRLRTGIPFIVTDLELTPGAKLPLPEFRARYGHVPIIVPTEPQPSTLEEMLTRIEAREQGLYTLGTELPEELWPEFPAHYLREHISPPSQLWFGAGKNADEPVTHLHRDLGIGFLQQVYGRKRIQLFAPHEAPFLYPKTAFFSYQQCWVQPHAPDLVRFPRFKDAHAVECILSPGELLIHSLGWFHQVYSLDDVTLSVSNFVFYEPA